MTNETKFWFLIIGIAVLLEFAKDKIDDDEEKEREWKVKMRGVNYDLHIKILLISLGVIFLAAASDGNDRGGGHEDE